MRLHWARVFDLAAEDGDCVLGIGTVWPVAVVGVEGESQGVG